jgi:transcriptional regulator with XRE-family HTH domain
LLQEELAERIGVSRSAVQKWERGQATPRVQHLSAISELTGRPLTYFAEAAQPQTAADIAAATAQHPDTYPGVEALLADEATCASLGVTPDEARLLREGWALLIGPHTLSEAVELLQTLRHMTSRRGA